MLVPRIINSKSTDHKPVNSGCCRWIFSTVNGREFCKAGKVVSLHSWEIYLSIYIDTQAHACNRALARTHTLMVTLFFLVYYAFQLYIWFSLFEKLHFLGFEFYIERKILSSHIRRFKGKKIYYGCKYVRYEDLTSLLGNNILRI
jgi:hypothetical protein